jgi:3-deoxy-7-phosphoheptulonate synthase
MRGWRPGSWRDKPAQQQPSWPDPGGVERAVWYLGRVPALVSPVECRALRAVLGSVVAGQTLLLHAGECAERFAEVRKSADRAELLGGLTGRLAAGSGVPVVAVGRMAGQYAKPRSSDGERIDGPDGTYWLPSYRGDQVNDPAPDIGARRPDPSRLVRGYHCAAATLSILRALRTRPEPFVSHEALLLPYEEALTRYDTDSNQWYATSGHLLWAGDRTRHPDHAHLEYLAGIANPVAVKIGPTTTSREVDAICQRLNPDRLQGRLILIARMGAGKVRHLLPPLVQEVRDAGHVVGWVCDPMHGNTRVVGRHKTREVTVITAEIEGFCEVLREFGSLPAGLHLEVSSDDVTECLGGTSMPVTEVQLPHRYLTACDPRLNPAQAYEVVETAAGLMGPLPFRWRQE